MYVYIHIYICIEVYRGECLILYHLSIMCWSNPGFDKPFFSPFLCGDRQERPVSIVPRTPRGFDPGCELWNESYKKPILNK